MDIRFNEAQEILRKMVHDFLATECPKAEVREAEESEKGYSPELWKKMAELGWMGLIIPEEYDGMGYTFQDLTVLIEEAGKNILPSPLFCTTISIFPILDVGTEEQKKEFLPKIARGDLILTTAHLEPSGTFDASEITTKSVPQGNDFLINGTKLFVEMAHVADYFICTTRTTNGASPKEGITLFIIEANTAGISSEVIPTIGMDKLCEVKFDNVAVPKKNMLGKLDQGWPIMEKTMEKGAIVKSAESLGGIQTCVETTAAYMKERVQYDKPIGSFQALQHIMADMWVTMETSRYLIYEAAWMESEGIDCTKEASMAKAYVNEVYKNVTKWAIRLHGGIGTSRDHDIPLYHRRAKAADTSFGSTTYHREIVAHKIGL